MLRRKFVALVVFAAWGLALAEPQVRVLLGEARGQAKLTMSGAHRGFIDEIPAFETPLKLDWPVYANAGNLYVEGQPVGSTVRLEPLDEASFSWQGLSFRGSVRMIADGDVVQVVNVVGVEDYLRGVVPAEMPPEWPLEALKAQAVAARSYVLARLDQDEDYDVCAKEECQVYRGMAAEHPRSDQAISETRGVVLTHNGTLARAHYHADSGGKLASSAEVWGRSVPYLLARSDVPASSPHQAWQARLDPHDLAAALESYGVRLGPVTALNVLAHTESGRVHRAEVVAEGGRVVLEGTSLRDLLRSELGLSSTRFTMVGNLAVSGQGRGHGVGMSQYGARTLAAGGQAFEDILSFYYPNTALKTLPYR